MGIEMADIFKIFIKHMDGVNRAAVADAAAMAMAEHCDARMKKLQDALIQIRTVCDDNRSKSCDKGMALKFVRHVAADALKVTSKG